MKPRDFPNTFILGIKKEIRKKIKSFYKLNTFHQSFHESVLLVHEMIAICGVTYSTDYTIHSRKNFMPLRKLSN